MIVPINDGAGPGPDHTDQSRFDGFAAIAMSMLEYIPVGHPHLTMYPGVVEPAGFSVDPIGFVSETDLLYDLTTSTGRTAPNERLAWMEFEMGIGGPTPGATNLMGLFHKGIPSEGFGGWANAGAMWTMPTQSTPAHEFAHSYLSHVGCKDTKTYRDKGAFRELPVPDMIPDELHGGAIDPTHPNSYPSCSLAPVDEDGYMGFTTRQNPIRIFSNDPAHPTAAFPLMSYMNTKWNDAYHWCRLIDALGAPCVPAEIGVPPRFVPDPELVADCEPQVQSGAFVLDLCYQSGETDSQAPNHWRSLSRAPSGSAVSTTR